jgi:hypothetical protein
MKREDLINTKWDVRDWTEKMKARWQEKMFEYNFRWGACKIISHLNADFYYVYTCDLSRGGDQTHFQEHKHKDKVYRDLFPEEECELVYGDNCVVSGEESEFIYLCKDPRKGYPNVCVAQRKSDSKLLYLTINALKKALTQEEKDSIVKSKLEKVLLEKDAITVAEKLFNKGITEEDLL